MARRLAGGSGAFLPLVTLLCLNFGDGHSTYVQLQEVLYRDVVLTAMIYDDRPVF